MSESGANPEGYATARRVLLDAVRALHQVTNGIVLVGAQAVYLRAPDTSVPIAPFTLDGDLVADPRVIRRPRLISEALERAHFVPVDQYPGFYRATRVPADRIAAARVDVFVPERFANAWELEGYNAADARAVSPQPGLELALFDHSPMRLSALDDVEPERAITLEVAGTLALVVAKGWKLGERHAQGAEAFTEVTKDIVDVYRLLRASRSEEISAALKTLPQEAWLMDVARTGANYLARIFRDDRPAVRSLRTLLGTSEESEIVVESLQMLVEEFVAIVTT